MKILKNKRGNLSGLALGLVTAVVALFIGLYMISQVSQVAAIDNTSDFYDIYTGLASKTSTVYDVMILVIIVVALGVAIAVLRGFGQTPETTSSI